MSILMSFVRYIFLGVLSLGIAYLTLDLIGHFYYLFFHPQSIGIGDMGIEGEDVARMHGFLIGYAFTLPLLFISLGDQYRYWALSVFLIPALLSFISDQSLFSLRAFVPYALGFVLGFLLRKLAERTLGKMPALEPYKKYF